MECDKWADKVAAGLRAMESKPSYFLFCDSDSDFTWDESYICGIPVVHSAFISNDMTDSDVPFITLWHSEHVDLHRKSREQFNRAFAEF